MKNKKLQVLSILNQESQMEEDLLLDARQFIASSFSFADSVEVTFWQIRFLS